MRRASTTLPLLLLAGLVLLGSVTPALAGREPARVTFTGVTVTGRERPGKHFEADRLSSLIIHVEWRTLVGAHTQRLELIAPDGAVYQRFTAPVESVTGRARVDTRLPVGGSWITQYNLHGRWQVHVYLDDAATPVTSATFTLAK